MKSNLSFLPTFDNRRNIDYLLLGAFIGSFVFFVFTLALFRVSAYTFIHIGILAGLSLYVRRLWTEAIPRKVYHYLFAFLTILGDIGFILFKSEVFIICTALGAACFSGLKLIHFLAAERKSIVYTEQDQEQKR